MGLNTPLGYHTDYNPMGLSQYYSSGEYCGPYKYCLLCVSYIISIYADTERVIMSYYPRGWTVFIFFISPIDHLLLNIILFHSYDNDTTQLIFIAQSALNELFGRY